MCVFTNSKDMRGSEVIKKATCLMSIKGQLFFLWLVPAKVHLHTKFEVSSFIHFRDRRGST